jgi:hypothetical protein
MPKRIYNQRANLPDHRDLVHYEPMRATALPLKFDLWQEYPEIRRWNQASQGSCGPHSQARAAMHELLKAGVTFSQDWTTDAVSPGDRIAPAFGYYTTRQIMGTTDQDSGVDNRSLFQALLKYGSTREANMPYNDAVFATAPSTQAYSDASKWEHVSYKSVVPTHGNLRSTLVQGHAIVQAFSVPDYFEEASIWNPAEAYLPLPKNVSEFKKFIGGHDTVLTGYDYTCSTWPIPVFIVDNSWGDDEFEGMPPWGLAFEAPSKRVGRFAMDARWQGQSNLVMDLTALISDAA